LGDPIPSRCFYLPKQASAGQNLVAISHKLYTTIYIIQIRLTVSMGTHHPVAASRPKRALVLDENVQGIREVVVRACSSGLAK